MKAIVYKKYGNFDIVEYMDVDKPTIDADTILIKVKSASINAMDIRILNGKPYPLRFMTGLFKPKIKILGADFSGVVEEVGENIEMYNVGDEVFGTTLMNQNGAYAEYTLVGKYQLALKPENVSFSEAAALPIAGLTALQALKDAKVTEGSNVLIHGASGGVGTFAIQIAKALKANVTAVCSTRNIESAKKSGADKIIDYKKENWYDVDDSKYDAILGVNGYTHLKKYRDALTDEGIFVSISGTTKQILQMYLLKPFMRKKGKKKFLGFITKINKKDLDTLSEMLEKNRIKPIFKDVFKLEDTKKALEHYLKGKTIGKTIIDID